MQNNAPYTTDTDTDGEHLCEPVAAYCRKAACTQLQLKLFTPVAPATGAADVRVVELFAGVGGFRVGLERASSRFKVVWSNQWEPSTKRQDASAIYCRRFGAEGHSNADIASVAATEIPETDLLCGGFPCQDYSVATTLKRSGGIEGKKGVLWWEIHRILKDSASKPKYLVLENVDRLLKSPSSRRGRDFAIILASLSDLGYDIEWRVINAADYGMPQRRKRTYMVGIRHDCNHDCPLTKEHVLTGGILPQAFPCAERGADKRSGRSFVIGGTLDMVSDRFNTDNPSTSPFCNAGIMSQRHVCTVDVDADYDGPSITLGDIMVDESLVPEQFFISEDDLGKWKYLKGHKSMTRRSADGHEYKYSEGAMAFPDDTGQPSRTIITGEGGAAPSRFKHVILTPSGRYRRLMPIELERLNMFPDNHTLGASDSRRAFLMGNALVTGIVERIGRQILISNEPTAI